MQLVHRSVAKAFIPNPNNLPITSRYNNNYGDRNEKSARSLTNNIYFSKPVVQFARRNNQRISKYIRSM